MVAVRTPIIFFFKSRFRSPVTPGSCAPRSVRLHGVPTASSPQTYRVLGIFIEFARRPHGDHRRPHGVLGISTTTLPRPWRFY